MQWFKFKRIEKSLYKIYDKKSRRRNIESSHIYTLFGYCFGIVHTIFSFVGIHHKFTNRFAIVNMPLVVLVVYSSVENQSYIYL